jgi:hypothetical protein
MQHENCHPGVDNMAAVYNKYNNTIFMERGQGPHDMFAQQLPGAISQGDSLWEGCYGSDKSKWPFNTACCAYNQQSATCKSPSGRVVV